MADTGRELLPPTPECESGFYCPFTDNGAYHGVCLWHEGPERTCTCDGRTPHQPATAAPRVCPRCGDDLSHNTTKVFRCRRWSSRIEHDPHHWVGKATDVLFYCDGVTP